MPVTLLSQALQQPVSPSSAAHIVLLVDQFPRVLGGGERVVLRLAELLTRGGYRVSIVTFAVLCPAETLDDAACPIYLLPLTSAFRAASLQAAWQFGQFLRREKVRIVQTFFESSNLFGGIATKALSRAKLIWNRRDMGILREEKHRTAYRLLRRLPDAVIAVSEQVRQHAVEADRIPADRVTVIYNGLNSLLWKPGAARQSESLTIATVGNIRPVKGHDVLVESAATVLRHHPGARFIIAGEALEPDYFQALQQRAKQLGIQDNICFPGSLQDPGELLRSADLFVLPSRSEGFSNAIVEAMLTGLPVVATTVGGNGEAVQQGETGLLVQPDSPAALAEAMLSLLGDAGRRQLMGNAGRQRAQRLFSEESTLQRMVAVFDGVLGTR